MNNSVLIADSGSTKTNWAFKTSPTDVLFFSTPGINPLYQDSNSIEKMLRNTDVDWTTMRGATVRFYGAGCIGGDANNTIVTALNNVSSFDNITVMSDMMAACHALLGHKAGIACILGTGANSCCFDGEQIVANTPPLGFILGDEGSGAYIGKRLMADALKGLLPTDLSSQLLQWCELSYAEIIAKVYREPYPNRFLASLTHFAANNLHRDEIHNIILESFVSFIDRNLMRYDAELLSKPIGFVGSVAFHFEYILAEALELCGLKMGSVEQSPLERLVDFE